LVLEWSTELLKAGADILEAPSLGGDAFTAAEHSADRSRRREWTRAAVAIACEASAGQKFVIGAVGPSLDLLSFSTLV